MCFTVIIVVPPFHPLWKLLKTEYRMAVFLMWPARWLFGLRLSSLVCIIESSFCRECEDSPICPVCICHQPGGIHLPLGVTDNCRNGTGKPGVLGRCFVREMEELGLACAVSKALFCEVKNDDQRCWAGCGQSLLQLNLKHLWGSFKGAVLVNFLLWWRLYEWF